MTCANHRTANGDEDQGDAPADPESQDEDDMGYGTRPGGGFTSMVNVQPHSDIELKYVVDNIKGCCFAWPVNSPEEAVDS